MILLQRMVPLMEPTPILVQRDISPNNNSEKLTREARQLASENEKQYWKSNNCCFDKKEKALVWAK